MDQSYINLKIWGLKKQFNHKIFPNSLNIIIVFNYKKCMVGILPTGTNILGTIYFLTLWFIIKNNSTCQIVKFLYEYL